MLQALSFLISPAILLQVPPAPATRFESLTETIHGYEIQDDFRWLEPLESESDEVKAWTDLQNQRTRAALDAHPKRKNVEDRIEALYRVDSIGLPTVRGELHFNLERRGEAKQASLMRRQGAEGEAEVLLDPASLDNDGLTAIDWFAPDATGKHIAFGLSRAGDEMSILHILDAESGNWLTEEIPGKAEFCGWRGSTGFVYGILTDPNDAYSRVFRHHTIGRHPRHDEMLLAQESPSRIPDLRLHDGGRWAVAVHFEGWSKQDILAAPTSRLLKEGESALQPVAIGYEARFEPQFVHGDALYMISTLGNSSGALWKVDLWRPDREYWKQIYTPAEGSVLQSASYCRGELVLTVEREAATQFFVSNLQGESVRPIPLPGIGTASIAVERSSTSAFVSYASFNTPNQILQISLADNQTSVWAAPDLPFDPESVDVQREWCISKDGTRVPMFVVRKSGSKGPAPTIVYGYGGFNITIPPRFIGSMVPWIEAGGVYASVNLRGGGEFGEAWHQDGMLQHKQNVFDDLRAAGEHLVSTGIAKADALVAMGGSNGGLLAGVAAVQQYDLWAGSISMVPLLDMVRYPKFLMAKFWIPEYGDPEVKEDLGWILPYSPYHNVVAGRQYPSVLITAGENDNRVHPMHARKLAALLQRDTKDEGAAPILLWVDREAGHGRGKPMDLRIRDAADRIVFAMQCTDFGG